MSKYSAINLGTAPNLRQSPYCKPFNTVTYLQRYTLKAALGLAAAQDDDAKVAEQRVGNDNISLEQYQELCGLIEQAGIDEKIVLDAAKVSALDFLPARQFQTIKNKLLTTIKAKGGK